MIGIHVRFGVAEHEGAFFAWYTLDDDEPIFHGPFATREEARVHNRKAAENLKEKMELKRGVKVRLMNRGSEGN